MRKITISESGSIDIPDNVQMTSFEIADLFGVYIQTINSSIKVILKSHIVDCDNFESGTMDGAIFIPNYFGLDMITALAFRIDSFKVRQFREWIFCRIETEKNIQTAVYIQLSSTSIPN